MRTDEETGRVELPAAGEYRVDTEESTIAFRTRHIFGLAGVTGSFRLREGHLRVAEEITGSSAYVTIPAASFHTGLSARDTMVRSDRYLDVEHHPHLTFASTRLSHQDGRWTLYGTLTVRGRDCPVAVHVDESDVDGPRLRLRASARIDRYECGITAMKGMTGRWLALTVDLRANRV